MPARPDTAPEPTVKETFGAFRAGYTERPADEDWAAILDRLQRAPEKSADPLGGRVATALIDLPHWGRVVMKHYARGGLMRYVSRRLHLRSRTSRAAGEFATLQRLLAAGVPVPQPLLWVETGMLFTENWLIITEIPEAQSLADIARQDPARSEALIPRVVAMVEKLIELRIHHVDFHPGNVLINAQDEVFPIDFDKALVSPRSQSELSARYRNRWNRAIAKHGLPTALEFSVDFNSLDPSPS